MKNLAQVDLCDIDIALELQAAGVRFERLDYALSEVPYHLVGKLGKWTFIRSWYYWKATAPDGEGVPDDNAKAFNNHWRGQVRVAGFAGGTDVHNWLSSSGTIDSYHIDTQEGLNAFADLVRKLAK
jgi:hypothetical protein